MAGVNGQERMNIMKPYTVGGKTAYCMTVHHWPLVTMNLLHLQDIKPAKLISGRAGKTGEKVYPQTSVIPSHLSGQNSNMTKRSKGGCRDRNGED